MIGFDRVNLAKLLLVVGQITGGTEVIGKGTGNDMRMHNTEQVVVLWNGLPERLVEGSMQSEENEINWIILLRN